MDDHQQDVFEALGDVTPSQEPSVHDKLISLQFPSDISIDLRLSAAPGCGGVTWPAGEVVAQRFHHSNLLGLMP